jgi:hypothetical protein
MKGFFRNELYALMIAKIAIIFQSVMTMIISISLFLMIYTKIRAEILIIVCLYLDTLFVITHILYRKLYSGRRIILGKNDVVILLVHIMFSLLAIILTFFLIFNMSYIYDHAFMWLVLLSWIMSLVLGVIFYTRKYKKVILE